MNKLVCLSHKCCFGHDDQDVADGFIIGFKEAFKVINEKTEDEIKLLEQYPMTSERIFAIKKHQDKLNKMLDEMVQEYE